MAIREAIGVQIALSSADTHPLEMTTSARPVTPDWGLALGISSAGFAARAFTGDRRSLESVRRFTREVLSAWGLTALTDDMTTVVSELVTNALRHALEGHEQAPGKAWLGMLRTGGALVCAVADPDPSPPLPQAPDPLAEDGWGLRIVDALTSQWGYCETDSHGKAVWARIALPSA
ncbi:ATP-binding protein [Streptomyces sp. NEAU-YJ-81]|uniref:ATP-binding protein n=1 Tax=Streptomyces sp. NEAU-YJ-81 TaxID=2820288 RepID=UPI001ABC9899|nr:ATP-binding protein [Streptomyces sp. NEAU-YJ-81]MBO3682848.1 ATP-binding protein [Streptomyces sp. NEAU-YJ-81]